MGQATCDWLSVLHSPALQPILLAGVVLDVGIEVEVRAHGVAQPVLIGQRAPGSTRDRRPTPGAFPVGGSDSARPGRGSVPNPPNGGTWSVQDGPLPARGQNYGAGYL